MLQQLAENNKNERLAEEGALMASRTGTPQQQSQMEQVLQTLDQIALNLAGSNETVGMVLSRALGDQVSHQFESGDNAPVPAAIMSRMDDVLRRLDYLVEIANTNAKMLEGFV